MDKEIPVTNVDNSGKRRRKRQVCILGKMDPGLWQYQGIGIKVQNMIIKGQFTRARDSVSLWESEGETKDRTMQEADEGTPFLPPLTINYFYPCFWDV